MEITKATLKEIERKRKNKMKTELQQAIENLGHYAKDKVSGLEGIITHVKIHITGCVQNGIMPASENGEIKKTWYFDLQVLEVGERKIDNFYLKKCVKKTKKQQKKLAHVKPKC